MRICTSLPRVFYESVVVERILSNDLDRDCWFPAMPAKNGEGDKRKRGRKPKGGKVVASPAIVAHAAEVNRNVILHFACTTHDVMSIKQAMQSNDVRGESAVTSLETVVNNPEVEKNSKSGNDLWEKVKTLNDVLHRGTGLGKSSDCFWCTCPFSTPPVHIPRSASEASIECYGCFCSPECALAFLLNERIDQSRMFERVALLNTVYGGVFGHKRSIRPAPDPHYLLDKYYGSMTIDEYRELLGSAKRLIVVDKPLTRAVPHLFDDTDEMCDPSLLPSNKNDILKSAFNCR